MQNSENNDSDANNSNGGDSYGQLKADNIQLKDQLQHCRVVGQVFIHYLCVQGADCSIPPSELQEIHHAYLNSVDALS